MRTGKAANPTNRSIGATAMAVATVWLLIVRPVLAANELDVEWKSGVLLSEALRSSLAASGWQTQWSAHKDWRLEQDISYHGRRGNFLADLETVTGLTIGATPNIKTVTVSDRTTSGVRASPSAPNPDSVTTASPIVPAANVSGKEPAKGELLPTPVALPPNPPVPSWTLEASKTLKANIEAWSVTAGWAPPQWDAANWYEVTHTVRLEGPFPHVLRQIAESAGINICARTQEKYLRVTDQETRCDK